MHTAALICASVKHRARRFLPSRPEQVSLWLGEEGLVLGRPAARTRALSESTAWPGAPLTASLAAARPGPTAAQVRPRAAGRACSGRRDASEGAAALSGARDEASKPGAG